MIVVFGKCDVVFDVGLFELVCYFCLGCDSVLCDVVVIEGWVVIGMMD